MKWSFIKKQTNVVCILFLHRLDPFKVQLWQYCLYMPVHYGESFNVLENNRFFRCGTASIFISRKILFSIISLSVHLSVHLCISQFHCLANKNVLGNFDFPWGKIYEVCPCHCWLWLSIFMPLLWRNNCHKKHIECVDFYGFIHLIYEPADNWALCCFSSNWCTITSEISLDSVYDARIDLYIFFSLA